MRLSKSLLITIALTLLMTFPLAACSATDAIEGNRISDLDFTVLGESEQPEALKEIIVEKLATPFQLSYVYENDLYIVVGYGTQTGGGYSIVVNQFYETDTTLVFDTTLKGPEAGETATDITTTPYIVIKTMNHEDKTIEFK
jgi:hypothetical protein